MEMHDALRFRNCLVNHTMDDPSCGIDFCALYEGISLDVDFEEVGCGYFFEQHTEGNEQEPVVAPRQARREMGEYQIIHFAAREDPIAGGKLQPRTSCEGRQCILAAVLGLHHRLPSRCRGHCADEGLARRQSATTPPPPGCGGAAAPAPCDRRRPS